MNVVATRLLGGLIRHPDTIVGAVTVLISSRFSSSADRVVFAALSDLHARGRPIDLVELFNALRASGQLEAAGGTARLAELWDRACKQGEVPALTQYLAAG